MGPARSARSSIRRVAVVLGLLFPPSGYAGISLFCAHVLTQSSNRPSLLEPARVSPSVQEWAVETDDGLTLRGWYYPTREHRRLIVCVHGMQMNWSELAGVGRDLHDLGYDVLLFDLRGHGRSDPARLSMGRFERLDLRAVLQWAWRNGFTSDRIGWIGSSMGAATVLMEGALNRDIRVAVLDSPFANLPELLTEQLNEHSGLPRLFNPGILLAARLAYGVRTDDLVPLRVAHLWEGRPLLLIHGGADRMVPPGHSQQLAGQAGATCQLYLRPGVTHADAYRCDPEWYIRTIDEFFERHL